MKNKTSDTIWCAIMIVWTVIMLSNAAMMYDASKRVDLITEQINEIFDDQSVLVE